MPDADAIAHAASVLRAIGFRLLPGHGTPEWRHAVNRARMAADDAADREAHGDRIMDAALRAAVGAR